MQCSRAPGVRKACSSTLLQPALEERPWQMQFLRLAASMQAAPAAPALEERPWQMQFLRLAASDAGCACVQDQERAQQHLLRGRCHLPSGLQLVRHRRCDLLSHGACSCCFSAGSGASTQAAQPPHSRASSCLGFSISLVCACCHVQHAQHMSGGCPDSCALTWFRAVHRRCSTW